jgi:hypothetical protein
MSIHFVTLHIAVACSAVALVLTLSRAVSCLQRCRQLLVDTTDIHLLLLAPNFYSMCPVDKLHKANHPVTLYFCGLRMCECVVVCIEKQQLTC